MVKKIENTFDVKTSTIINTPEKISFDSEPISDGDQKTDEPTCFDIILDKMPDETQKTQRLTIFRIIRELTSLSMKESKELTNSLPNLIKESLSHEEVQEVKKQLEAAGAEVTIQ